MIVGNEKPEQTIELDSDNKTYVLKYVPENKKESPPIGWRFFFTLFFVQTNENYMPPTA